MRHFLFQSSPWVSCQVRGVAVIQLYIFEESWRSAFALIRYIVVQLPSCCSNFMNELMEYSLITVRIIITGCSFLRICVLENQRMFVCSEVMHSVIWWKWFCKNMWVINSVLVCCWHILKTFSSAKSYWAVQSEALANDLQVWLFYRSSSEHGRIPECHFTFFPSLEDPC